MVVGLSWVPILVGILMFSLAAPLSYTPRGLIAAAVVAPLTAAYTAYYLHKSGRVDRLLTSLDEGRPLDMTAGLLEIYIEHKGKLSKRWIKFTPTGEVAGVVKPGPYAYISGRRWEYLAAYAYRVEDSCCDGLYVALIDPAYTASIDAQLEASTPQGDVARAYVRPAGPGQVEAGIELWKAEASSARLELVAEVPGAAEGEFVLAATEEGAHVEIVDIAAMPLKLVIAGSTNLKLIKHIGKALAGLGPGPRYRLRLVIDTPTARAVVKEVEITPSAPGG